MTRPGFALRLLLRDWHSGELRLIVLALIVAVASLTTVGFFTDRIEQTIEIQATELLAADLVLSATAPVPASIGEQARRMRLQTTSVTAFRSVVVKEDRFQMAEVKAVAAGYPLRGELRVADRLFGEEYTPAGIPAPGEAWADSRLLQQLGVELNEQIELGATHLTLSRVLTFEPDRGGDIFNIAPRLMINRADVAATGLILPGSRVSYYLLLGGEAESVAAFRQWFEAQHGGGTVKIRGIRDARPELKTALERASQFLGLAALVSVALAGMAVAMSTQRYVRRHLDYCAIMRCIGATQGTVLSIYLLQCLLLALLCSVLGTGLGFLGQAGLASLMSGLVQGELPAPSAWPAVSGLLTGLITVCGFAMPQLLRLRAVSPMRVLRRDLTPVPVSSRLVYVLAILALALLLPWQSGDVSLSLYSFAGLLATGVALALAARGAIYLIRRLRLSGVVLRYGLANVSRRGGQSIAQVLGIGLGLTAMLLLFLIRTDLLENWRESLPAGTPNYFLINVQPDEVRQLGDFIFERGRLLTEFYPMIRGRLVRINDRPVSPEDYADDRARRLVAREFNLSFAEQMQGHNRLVAGHWWASGETGVFSVEEGIAQTLGIRMGDHLTYLVAGREVSAVASNLRWVEWDSFNVNFFVVSDPATLAGYPATYITSFYLPPAERLLLSDIVREFPSVTVFDVDAILTQVRQLMNQVIRTIEYVSGFTLLAGLIVLFAALQTTHDERLQESALLSSLGASRRQILGALLAEFLCLGLIAGLLAAFGATLVEWLLAHYVFNLTMSLNPVIWFFGPLLSMVLIGVGGVLGTRHVLSAPPMRVLRQGT